jgi:hypothetical protein
MEVRYVRRRQPASESPQVRYDARMPRLPTRLALAAVPLLLAACGKDGGGGAPAEGKPPDPAVIKKAVEEANAAVPEGLKASLKFVERKVGKEDKDALVAVVPDGWEESTVIPGSFKPPKNLGFMTKFSVGSNCDGTCQDKDWAEVFDRVDAKVVQGTTDKDEKLENGRLLVQRSGSMVFVVVGKWQKGAKRYYTCRAVLDKEAQETAPAFEKACRSIMPVRW